MTIERKIIVGLGDIKAVVFECRQCRARVSVSPDGLKVPRACPCGKPWAPDYVETVNTPKFPYSKFCTALSQCRTLQDNDAAFTILLEFDAPEFEDKS